MGRVSKKIIDILSDVIVAFDGQTAIVKGSRGELTRAFDEGMAFKQDEDTLEVVRPTDSKEDRTIHNTTRVLLNNMVQGISQGFVRTLELVGASHRAQMQGNGLVLNIGYSYPIEVKAEDGITFVVEKNTTVTIFSVSKEQVGAIASNIHSVRLPGSYKGRGIRYQGEYVRRREGETGK